jgi:hypothetical protein
MQDVGQSEALAKQSVKCEKRAFSCEKYGLDAHFQPQFISKLTTKSVLKVQEGQTCSNPVVPKVRESQF